MTIDTNKAREYAELLLLFEGQPSADELKINAGRMLLALADAHDRMAKDAARYQKVRRLVVDYNQPLQWDGQGKPPVDDMSDWLDCSTDTEFDVAIDAAMGADPKND